MHRRRASRHIVELRSGGGAKPETNEYPASLEDRVEQVVRYARKLRAGNAKTDEGRAIAVAQSTPFYAYVVCTLTPKIEEIALDWNFTPTPDGAGYFKFHNQVNCYIEHPVI